MSKKQEKAVSAIKNGVVIYYNDAKKHKFVKYDYSLLTEKEKVYQRVQEKPLSSTQEYLYSKLLYGFNIYSQEELDAMSQQTRNEIRFNYTKAHKLLNRWKQEVLFTKLDDLLLSLFPKSPVVKQFTDVKGFIDDVPVNEEISLKEAGLTRDEIINKLIEFKLLPTNFYQL